MFIEFKWQCCYIWPSEATDHCWSSRLLDSQLLWAVKFLQAWQRSVPAHTAKSAGSLPPGAQSLQVKQHNTSSKTSAFLPPSSRSLCNKNVIKGVVKIRSELTHHLILYLLKLLPSKELEVSIHQNKPFLNRYFSHCKSKILNSQIPTMQYAHAHQQ